MDDQNKKDKEVKPEIEETAKTPEAPSEEKTEAPESPVTAETPAASTSEQSPVAEANSSDTVDTAAEPAPQPIPSDVGYTETKSSKMVYILVAILLVILLSLVGLFFYKQMNSTPSDAQLSPTPAQVSPTAAVSPTLTPANEEEAELQQIDIPDIDEDLQQIESDLNQL